MDNFEQKLLDGLNPEQREVVLHDKDPLLVVAVAGAGKTHALVNRVGYLVGVRDINPNKVLAVTFSRDGAREMQERLNALIGKSGARIGTFHSLGLEIIKAENPDYEEWTIDVGSKYKFCLKDATGYREMNWKTADLSVLESYASMCKANLARPESDVALALAKATYARVKKPSATPHLLVEAYSIAEGMRRDKRLITFDDMMMESVEMLRDDEEVRVRWASKFDYVLQDEAQDQNLCQLMMGELLAQDHRNYMLVGDPAQCIYTWRGAQPSKLLQFEGNWGAKVVKMGRNYRCGKVIIDAANRSLDSMDPATRLDVKMLCERTDEDGDQVEGDIRCRQYVDLDDEGFGITDYIQELIQDGAEPRSIAVLYRTNAQSRAPEEALISARIPYRVIGGVSFYERKEVKALLSYLRLGSGIGKIYDIAQCINTPFRFLGRAFVDRVKEEADRGDILEDSDANWPRLIREVAEQGGIQQRQKASVNEWAFLIDEINTRIKRARGAKHGTDAQQHGAPARILEDIIRSTGFVKALTKDEGEETTENSKVSNIREMVRAAERFSTVDELLEYVDKTLAASKKQSKERDPDKVTLCSIHKSKGLEWPSVFLVGASDKILPHGRSDDPEEERRLFYVAVTRARDLLHVSCVENMAFGSRVLGVEPSHFLYEIGGSLTA